VDKEELAKQEATYVPEATRQGGKRFGDKRQPVELATSYSAVLLPQLSYLKLLVALLLLS
jgi:hypothetical protein